MKIKDENTAKQDTILDDSASIYQRREVKSERQKFSEMKTFQEKLTYFKMYYLATTIGIVVGGALLIYLLYSIFSPKDEIVLRMAIVDYLLPSEISDQMETDFVEATNFELGDHQRVKFDGQSYLVSGGDPNTLTVLATHLVASEIDVMLAPEAIFRNYAFNGMMISPTDILPSDLYAEVSDELYFCKLSQNNESYEECTSDEYVLGVYLDKTTFWKDYTNYFRQDERPVIGIIANSKNKENAITLLRYMFESK